MALAVHRNLKKRIERKFVKLEIASRELRAGISKRGLKVFGQ